MAKRIGILLGQLGTPDAPTPSAVRRYLRQFLGDRRVVDLNPLLWWLILNGIILPRRSRQSAALYRKVWTDEGSPLLRITNAQARGLQQRLQASGAASGAAAASASGVAAASAAGSGGDSGDVEFRVEVAMRYGNPSTGLAIDTLCAWGASEILLFPMYPQYSAPTTGSTYDEVFRELGRRRLVPTLRIVPPYFDDPLYIAVLAQSIREKLAASEAKPDKILISFHGIPERYATLGDPYPEHCVATVKALAAAMGWTGDEYLLTFQSRFGKEPWLQPYTDQTLMKLGSEHLGRILVICPGFTADCLETIDEIGNLGREQFEGKGGGELDLVPCLNDRPRWLDSMAAIARRELAGWL
jgi:ferrochelatase